MAPLFTKSALLPSVGMHDIGKAERPFQILGLVETLAFGDLISNVVFLSTLANQFDHARLHVKFRDARPYSRYVFSLTPSIDVAEPIPDKWPTWMGTFSRHFRSKPRPFVAVSSQKGKRAVIYDMIISSYMTQGQAVHALPNIAPLRLPATGVDKLRAHLIGKGLDPAQWFAAIHYRESTYAYRHEGSERNSDPTAFDALVDHIIALGGQVVRLGHIGMAPFRPRPGFIDLVSEPIMVQAAAASYARFMVVGPSGCIALAMGFQTPVTLVDAIDTFGMWGPSDALSHVVKTPSCQTLRNGSLRDAGLLDSHILAERMREQPGYKIRKANAEELRTVAQKLFARTTDCVGWRTPANIVGGPKPNCFPWPLKPTNRIDWVDI
jgi:putative glycosyltransferase (TIGR04372 family)